MVEDNTNNLNKLENALQLINETDRKLNEIVNSKMFQSITEILQQSKESLLRLEKEKENLKKEQQVLAKEKEQLELETKRLEKEKEERDVKITSLNSQQKKLLEEYEALKVDLNKFQKLATESSNKEFDFKQIQDILKIYITLMEQIYQTKPHVRIIYVLHGDREEMHRKDIVAATGIGGAYVLNALFELDKAKIITYDENTGIAKLVKRIFPKEDKNKDKN